MYDSFPERDREIKRERKKTRDRKRNSRFNRLSLILRQIANFTQDDDPNSSRRINNVSRRSRCERMLGSMQRTESLG